MTPIKPDIERVQRVLDGLEREMHPGDYGSALTNIVHYALVEVERLCKHLGSNAPMADVVGDLMSIASIYVPDGNRPH